LPPSPTPADCNPRGRPGKKILHFLARSGRKTCSWGRAVSARRAVHAEPIARSEAAPPAVCSGGVLRRDRLLKPDSEEMVHEYSPSRPQGIAIANDAKVPAEWDKVSAAAAGGPGE